MSLVVGLGLEHSCPWPRECLSSERLSLALASDFFVSLALASSLVFSTPPLIAGIVFFASSKNLRFYGSMYRQIWVDVIIKYNISLPRSSAVERLFFRGAAILIAK